MERSALVIGDSEDCVLSEVHLGCHPDLVSHVSTFSIARTEPSVAIANGSDCVEGEEDGPAQEGGGIELDEDGDMVLGRRDKQWQRRWKRHRGRDCQGYLMINHRLGTGMCRVGLQVWKGGLLLTDFVLSSLNCWKGATVIELGAGTGLAGIVASQAARLVFITDRGTEVLDNCVRNVTLNAHLLGDGGGGIRVRELDWLEPWPPGSGSGGPYNWSPADVEEAQKASFVIAADVIYSVEMTASFFRLLENLLSAVSRTVLYLALERRYNFSLRECDVVAPGYKEFRAFFCDATVGPQDPEVRPFMGEQIAVNSIPQCLAEYERGNDLELWKIWRRCRCPKDDGGEVRL